MGRVFSSCVTVFMFAFFFTVLTGTDPVTMAGDVLADPGAVFDNIMSTGRQLALAVLESLG